MGIDAHRLLWQQLNKMYGNGANSVFVLAIGKYLNYSDYSPTENLTEAGHNTFELVNSCIASNVNYSPTGSRISIQWEQLLYHGKGPGPTEAQRPAFEKAKASLYTNYETREHTELYKKYLKAKAALAKKKVAMMIEYQQKYGDSWEDIYEQMLIATDEYLQFDPLDREVSPLLQAIEDWEYGPLANVVAPMKEVFEDNERSVVLPDESSKIYYYVSMIPSTWYEWLDPSHPEDGSWISITVDQHTLDDEHQSKEYKKLGGMQNAYLSSSFASFIQSEGGAGLKVRKVKIGDSQDDIKSITLKVRSVQINRPWIDLTALSIKQWKIPGQGQGSWSTGVLDGGNNGSFPLLSTHMIVAKDIAVTASKSSKEINDTLKTFNPSVGSMLMGGLFSVGASSGQKSGTHGFNYDESSNTITLKGTQVIGFVCTLLPMYPT